MSSNRRRNSESAASSDDPDEALSSPFADHYNSHRLSASLRLSRAAAATQGDRHDVPSSEFVRNAAGDRDDRRSHVVGSVVETVSLITATISPSSAAAPSPPQVEAAASSSTASLEPVGWIPPTPPVVSSGEESPDASLDRVGAQIGRTVRSIQRMINVQSSKHEILLGDLGRLERWTDASDRLREEVAAAGGISALLLLFEIRVFAHESAILVKVCNICTYMARNTMCLGALSARGAIPAVLQAMQRHLSHGPLQACACNALNNLAMRSENRQVIAQAGGIPQIQQAMKRHPFDSRVQANGCNCLWNLAILTQNRPLIGAAGGVACILSAMKNHVDDSSLFGEGCGALWNLADHAPTRTTILQQGGVEVILGGMEKHDAVARVVMHRLCCGALESLLNDNDVGRVVLWKRANGLELILGSMAANVADEEVQSAACGILASCACGDLMNLAVPRPFCETLRERGSIALIIAALRQHPTSPKVQGRGCSAISYLSFEAPIRQALLEAGAVELVQTALAQHASDTVVFGTAVMALSQLTPDQDDSLVVSLGERATAA